MAAGTEGAIREQAGARSCRAAQAMVRVRIFLCARQEPAGGLNEGEYVLCPPSKGITWRRACVGEEKVAGDQLEVAPGPGERERCLECQWRLWRLREVCSSSVNRPGNILML